MITLSDLTINGLKHAIWIASMGSIPKGGYPIEQYRDELYRRTGNREGYYNS